MYNIGPMCAKELLEPSLKVDVTINTWEFPSAWKWQYISLLVQSRGLQSACASAGQALQTANATVPTNVADLMASFLACFPDGAHAGKQGTSLKQVGKQAATPAASRGGR